MEETTRRMGHKTKRKDSVEGQKGKMNSEKQTAIRVIPKINQTFSWCLTAISNGHLDKILYCDTLPRLTSCYYRE